MNAITKALRGKSLTVIQNLVCVVLIVIMCLLSFGTIFTVSFPMNAEVKDAVEDTLSNIAGDGQTQSYEIKEEIDVNLSFLIKSVSSIGKVVKSVTSAVNELQGAAESGTMPEESPIQKEDILNQDLIDFVVFIFAIMASFRTFWLVGLCNILLIALVVILPVACIISAIGALLGFLGNTDDPGRASHKISKGFHRIINVFPMLLLILVFLPDVKFGGAVYGILALCLVGLGVGVLVSRVKKYEGDDFKYLNILQIGSVVSLIGYILFFVNIVGSKLFNAVFEMLGGHAVNELTAAATGAKKEVDFMPVMLTLILLAVSYFVIKSLTRIVTRIACMSKSKSPTHILSAVIALAVFIIPVMMMNSEPALELAKDQKGNFAAMVVGIFIMLAAEIALTVLPKKLCPACSATRQQEIVTGSYIYGADQTADAADNAEAAEAVEATEDTDTAAKAEEAPEEVTQ